MLGCCFQNFVEVVPCKFLRKSIKHLTLLLFVASFPPQYRTVTCAMQVSPMLGPSTVWNASVGTVNQLRHRCSRIPSAACPAQVCQINIPFPVTIAEVFHIRVQNLINLIIAIYAPMIYTAPCIMFWMLAYPLRGEVGGGWALEFPSFLGPVKWERVPFGDYTNTNQRFSSAHLKFSLKFLRSSVASSCRCSE